MCVLTPARTRSPRPSPHARSRWLATRGSAMEPGLEASHAAQLDVEERLAELWDRVHGLSSALGVAEEVGMRVGAEEVGMRVGWWWWWGGGLPALGVWQLVRGSGWRSGQVCARV